MQLSKDFVFPSLKAWELEGMGARSGLRFPPVSPLRDKI